MPSTRSRRSLLADRVLALLTTDWTDAEEIMEAAVPLVPPGRALREYALAEERNNVDRIRRVEAGAKAIARRSPPSQAEAIRMGSRAIVNTILGSARDTKTIDVEYLPGRKRRMRLSVERMYAHHCCLHGGSCRQEDDRQEEVPGHPQFPTAAFATEVIDQWMDAMLDTEA